PWLRELPYQQNPTSQLSLEHVSVVLISISPVVPKLCWISNLALHRTVFSVNTASSSPNARLLLDQKGGALTDARTRSFITAVIGPPPRSSKTSSTATSPST